MPEDLEDCYAELDLEPSATAEDVKAAYLDLVKVWHPDRYQGESARLRKKAEDKLKAINQAYERIRTGGPVGQTASEPGNGTAKAADREPRSEPDDPLAPLPAPMRFGKRWGYVNGDGKLVINPRFDLAEPFYEGLACVCETTLVGYIDRRGHYAVHPQFKAGRRYSEGLAAVLFAIKWGYIDRAGKCVITPLFEDCGEFNEGLAPVCWRGRWGYIDAAGKYEIAPRFDEAWGFGKGWAKVRIGEQWGMVNRNGEVFFREWEGPRIA